MRSGTCDVCGGHGPVGLYCWVCEDTGMIYN